MVRPLTTIVIRPSHSMTIVLPSATTLSGWKTLSLIPWAKLANFSRSASIPIEGGLFASCDSTRAS